MPLKDSLIAEFKNEGASTKKMLERVPEKSFSWTPHEKSMSLGRLATHVAELTSWISKAIVEDEFDFAANPFKRHVAATQTELFNIFQKNFDQAIADLEIASDDLLMKKWTLRNGNTVFFELPKIAVIRSFALSHLIHHRGQLSVYLRMLDVPVPGMYGPSADER
jgi:uncharacterized damage-inducible protein DinB